MSETKLQPRWPQVAAAWAVTVAVAASAAYGMAGVDFSRLMWQRVGDGRYVHLRARLLAGVDRFYAANVPTGNAFLRFVGFPRQAGADGAFVFEQFVRANYVLWPRQAYVAEPRVTWRDADEVLTLQAAPPSDAELRAWGVATVVTFHRERGTPAVEVRRLATVP